MTNHKMMQNLRTTLLSFTLLFYSCGHSREDRHYGSGAGAFLIFGLIFIQAFALNSLYKYEWFQNARNSLRKVLSPLSVLGVFAGIVILIIGFRSEGLDRLLKYVGVSVASLSFYSGKWAKEQDLVKQKLYMRLIALSGSLIFVLLYFLKGAPGLK